MRRNAVCSLLLLACMATPFSLAAQVPELIHSEKGPRSSPLWVSAEAASIRGGDDLDWGLFTPPEAVRLREAAVKNRREPQTDDQGRQTAASASGDATACEVTFGVPIVERVDPKPNQSLAALVKHARAIYSGLVTEIAQGFFDGFPASLLQVEVERQFRASERVYQDEILVVYPFARFEAGGSRFCTGADSMARPREGDRVLVFIYDEPLGAEGKLVYPELHEILLQPASGSLVIPEQLRADRDLATVESLAQIEDALQKRLGRKPTTP